MEKEKINLFSFCTGSKLLNTCEATEYRSILCNTIKSDKKLNQTDSIRLESHICRLEQLGMISNKC
jgi:hypothetical protein